jgi:hypothetical protein
MMDTILVCGIVRIDMEDEPIQMIVESRVVNGGWMVYNWECRFGSTWN